jgi:hypothetical protein
MFFLEPKKWSSWLSLAEWWYNTNFDTSLRCTPFEALYGYAPPLISKVMVPRLDSPATNFLMQKQQMIQKLRTNLAQAQARIKKYADLQRTKKQFKVGDMVYVKLQPFRQSAFGIHQTLKLSTKLYGPFRVLEKIGVVAYKLQLPDTIEIHPVFHVSQLKQHIDPKAVPQDNLPLVTVEGYIKIEPLTILDTRAMSRPDEVVT